MPTTHVMKSGNMSNYYTPMTLNVYVVFVTTFLKLLLLARKTYYLGKKNSLFHEFNEVLPPTSTRTEEIEKWLRFFMVLTLHELANKYSHVRDQILGSPITPNFTSTCSTL